MATMKDVAKLAGVSHGTVSNIINGAKGVSLDKVQRVKSAMKELCYEPNAVARNLKRNKTMEFDVILPNIAALSLAQIYSNLSRFGTENGYVANLRLTNEDAELEIKLLNHALTYNIDGVVLMTCQPQNTALFQKLMANGLNIVFLEREILSGELDYVAIDLSCVIKDCVLQLIGMGHKDIGIIVGPLEYTPEEQIFSAYIEAYRSSGLDARQEHCAISSYDRESALKEAIRLLTDAQPPSAIIVSCTQFMEALRKAIELLDIPEAKQPLVLAPVPLSWVNIKNDGIVKLPLPYAQLSEQAFALLLERMRNGKAWQPRKILIPTECANISGMLSGAPASVPKRQTQKRLRVLMTVDKAKYVIETLVHNFENQTGYRVEIEAREYPRMYKAVRDEWHKSNYDVFDLDIPWIMEHAQQGVIEPLDAYMRNDATYVNDVPSEIFEKYVVHDGVIYGMPFTFCTQLLFYRKDFFADTTMQRMFYEQFKRDLRPPTTWREFNETARFFTRSFNPHSPTEFGTTLGSRISSGGTCEYLPRLWAFGGEVYDASGFTLASDAAVEALENYRESFRYAAPGSEDNWWPEQANEFREGRAAMMMTYADNILAVTEREKSQIIGKIGYDMIPGKINALGGWALTMNACGHNKAEAFEFMKWACSRELSVLSTILGGFVPCKTVVQNLEVANIYSWIPKMMEAHQYGRLRDLPRRADGQCMSEAMFENVLGESVYHAVTNLIKPKVALHIANSKLNRMLLDDD